MKDFSLGGHLGAKMSFTSGQRSQSFVPPEIDRWNWGAFLLHWIWGVGNSVFISLLMFVPFVNLVMPFVLGAKGSAWAWQNKKWESVEQFRQVQRAWTKWAIIIYICLIGLFVVAIPSLVLILSSAMKSSEAYQLGLAKLNANAQAVSLLGEPISSGSPMGSIQVEGATGSAKLSFSVNGSKGEGTVYLEATKEMGKWKVNKEELEIKGRPERINLSP